MYLWKQNALYLNGMQRMSVSRHFGTALNEQALATRPVLMVEKNMNSGSHRSQVHVYLAYFEMHFIEISGHSLIYFPLLITACLGTKH
jgi:hypothetical protein